MIRGRALAVTMLPALLTATGCASDQEAYCDAVEEHQEALTEIATDPGPGALLDALPIYRDLRDEAPGDLRDEWDTVVDRLAALGEALDAAGVDPDTWDPKQPPPGLTREQRRAITAAGRDLGDPATVTAMSGIEQHALDVCKTPLSR